MWQMSRDLICDGLGPGKGRCTVPRMRNDFESRPRDGLGHETQHNKLQAFKPLDGRAFEIQKKKRMKSVTSAGTGSFTAPTTKVTKSVSAQHKRAPAYS